jgi:hypothetical protein
MRPAHGLTAIPVTLVTVIFAAVFLIFRQFARKSVVDPASAAKWTRLRAMVGRR